MTGLIHSVETFGAADGPGVRYVVFFRGCGFRCKYCHNPDTWAEGGASEGVTADALLAKALRYRPYWGAEGGITASGGEPMLQAAFVAELFEKARALGVNTCLDTAAGPFRRESADVLKLLAASDLVMLDIKHIDSAAHRELTGAGNEAVLDCARYLDATGKRIWIRHVLVPGVNSDDAVLRRTADFIHSLSHVERVDVLPYHTLGEFKWKRLGLPYALEGVSPPAPELVARAREILGGER